jgi:hypothetical protein
MAEDKKAFVLYADLIHTVRKMPKEKQGELFMVILSYVNDENPIVEDLLIDLVFEPIKRQMKRDLSKYESVKEKRKESGRLAGLKSGEARRIKSNQIEPNRTNGSKNEPNEHVTVTDTVTDTVTVTDILLEKETKYLKENFEKFDFAENIEFAEIDSREKEEEKSCAKKENAFQEIHIDLETVKNKKFANESLESQTWIDSIFQINKFHFKNWGNFELKNFVDEFNLKLTSEGETKQNKRDWQSHFARDLKIKIEKLEKLKKSENGKITHTAEFENVTEGIRAINSNK